MGRRQILKSLNTLREWFPWPAEPPEAPMDKIYAFSENQETWKAIEHFLPTDANLILELGSFYGASAAQMANLAVNSTIVCCDTWLGSPEFLLSDTYRPLIDRTKLYDQFLKNMWKYKERLIPLRDTSMNGILLLASLGIQPDFIYEDAAHDAYSVLADLESCHKCFSKARIVGDDYNFEGVAQAVQQFLKTHPDLSFRCGNRWYALNV